MQYKRFSDKIVARFDKGEEIISSLRSLCGSERVTLAYISAIGAVGKFTVGVFSPEQKTYRSNSFEGDYEIVSLTGTVTTKDGQFYAHLHMSAGDASGKVFGGHLNSAEISATCEVVLFVIDGKVERAFSEEVGLNLFKFD